jgi:hypothetical protein
MDHLQAGSEQTTTLVGFAGLSVDCRRQTLETLRTIREKELESKYSSSKENIEIQTRRR